MLKHGEHGCGGLVPNTVRRSCAGSGTYSSVHGRSVVVVVLTTLAGAAGAVVAAVVLMLTAVVQTLMAASGGSGGGVVDIGKHGVHKNPP